MDLNANPNTGWSWRFVQALAAAGLRAACIAPGSRSTPLTLAFHAHPEIEVYRHLDERSAGFFALGMALATDRPIALVCTSGTAAVNFHPAVVEAYMSQVPLLVLTADRPPELRHSGANQTIDQVKLFGDHVLWSVDVALPHSDAPDVALRNVQATAARAYAQANGLRKGPVHLNFPFRKPLEPAASTTQPLRADATAVTGPAISRGRLLPTDEQVDTLSAIIAAHPRGLIVCGPRCPGGAFPQAVTALSQRSGYPILADPLSGVRFGPWVAATAVVGGYETFLQQNPGWPEPEVVLRFGAVPTSKWLNAYLARIAPRYRIHVRENGVWADDSHQTSHFWQVEAAVLCRKVAQRGARGATAWTAQVQATEDACWAALDAALATPDFDGAVLAALVAALPPEARLFAGNSLPVRHLDQYARPSPKPLHVFANRGASGIDGNISTGLGIAAATERPTVLVVGDVTFYHDMNGLLAARNAGRRPLDNVTIVLLNNNGGGIFRRLPIAQIEPPFTELFLTPHSLDFAHASRLYGLEHVRITQTAAFRTAFTDALDHPTARVIEVVTDGAVDDARRRELNRLVQRQVTP